MPIRTKIVGEFADQVIDRHNKTMWRVIEAMHVGEFADQVIDRHTDTLTGWSRSFGVGEFADQVIDRHSNRFDTHHAAPLTVGEFADQVIDRHHIMQIMCNHHGCSRRIRRPSDRPTRASWPATCRRISRRRIRRPSDRPTLGILLYLHVTNDVGEFADQVIDRHPKKLVWAVSKCEVVGEFADQVIDRHISTHLILLPRNPLVRREREDRLAIPLLLLYLEAVSS